MFEAIGVDMPNAASSSITDFGHANLTLEATTDTVVDTLGLTPLIAEAKVTITLMPVPFLNVLLHNLRVRQWSEAHSEYNDTLA